MTPQTVYAGGQILIAVTVEERYLSVSDVQAMSLTQMEQQKISKNDRRRHVKWPVIPRT